MDQDALTRARDLLHCQRGVLTRAQALDAGLTDKAIAVRLHNGRWQRLHTGVYATFSGEPPRDAQLWAAVLRAGQAAALSHHTAAELYGLLATPAPMIHVTVPSGSPVTRPGGVVVHYSGRLGQSRHPMLTPPRTRIEDTVLDLIEVSPSLDEAVSLVLRASASRRTQPERILAAMQRRARMPRRAALLRALGAAGDGTHSLLEFRYVTRVERPHVLPPDAGRTRSAGVGEASIRTSATTAKPWSSNWMDARRTRSGTAGRISGATTPLPRPVR